MLEFTPSSSFIERVVYAPDPAGSQDMTVYFKSGKSEVFTGTPKWLFDQFKQAESAGKFYNESVKRKPVKEEWLLHGAAIEDIKCGDRVEMDSLSGRVRVARFKSLT